MTGRARDALPLPCVLLCDVAGAASVAPGRRVAVEGCCSPTGEGLNPLYGGRRSRPVPCAAAALHGHVYARLLDQLCAVLVPLDGDVELASCGGFFGRLVGRGGADKFPDLVASSADLMGHAARLGPMSLLPPEIYAVLTGPGRLFQGRVRTLPRGFAFKAGPRTKHITLTLRKLRAGRVRLRKSVGATASTFVTGRRGTDTHREIWHGSAITAAVALPPKPPLHANPAVLTQLKASLGQPI